MDRNLKHRPETVRLLGKLHDNLNSDLFLLSFFFIYDSNNTGNKNKNKQMDYINLKSFCTANNPPEWEKILRD
jgi:hypothetical protein